MKITKGTPQAIELFKLLKKEGNLVDIYSPEFFDRQPDVEESPNAPFHKDGMAYIDEMEADPYDMKKPKNHLIFIFIERSNEHVIKKLLEIYPALTENFQRFHKPDFLILNLYTRQMLCISFSGENFMFAENPFYKKEVYFNRFTEAEGGEKYMNKFTEHDFYDVVGSFTRAVEQLSQSMYEWADLPYDADSIESSLDEGPQSGGLYYVDGDDESHTKEELEKYLEQYANCQNDADNALAVIRAFFPNCEWRGAY